MATIKIVSATSGSFQAQKATLMLDQLIIKTVDGAQRTYPIKFSIISLTVVSEHKNEVIFDIKLSDGAHFRGEADKQMVHHMSKFVGAAPAAAKVPEKTPEQVKKQNIVSGAIVLLVMLLILYKCSGDSDTPAGEKQVNIEREKSAVVANCHMMVENSLKSPGTADFPFVTDVTVSQDNKIFSISSYVDAQNSFGGIVRTYYVCEMEYNGGGQFGWKMKKFKLMK